MLAKSHATVISFNINIILSCFTYVYHFYCNSFELNLKIYLVGLAFV